MMCRTRETLRSKGAVLLLFTVALAAWTLPGSAAAGGGARAGAGARGGGGAALAEGWSALSLERAIGERSARYQPQRSGDTVILDAAHGEVRGVVSSRGVAITIAGRTTSLSLASMGRADNALSASEGAPSIIGSEARIERGHGVTEWFRALPSGLEQGFTVATRASGRGQLELTLQIDGDLSARQGVAREGETAVELVERGVVVARYDHLFALDADARPLSARMHVRGGRIVLVIDDRSARYPVVVDPLVVVEEGLLVPAGLAASDNLGVSVSISDDGTRAIVGAPETASGTYLNVGTAFIFVRRGINWTLETTLRRPGGGPLDFFGSAVAISGDGTVAIASAPGASEASCDCEVGGVWAYTRSGTTWSAGVRMVPSGGLTSSERLGSSLAITRDGSRAVVGALQFSSQRGEVYVFRRGPTWTQEARIAGTNNTDLLGAGVAISADGTRALAGMPGWDAPGSNSGGARVLVRSGTTWAVESTIVPSIATSSSDAGYALALSEDGSRALVSAWQSDVGATNAGGVSVFSRAGTAWSEEAVLLAEMPRAGAGLGASASLSADGRRALVGERTRSGAAVAGAARVFVRDGTTWSEAAVFEPTGAASGDAFGAAIAISGDGRRGVVGAPNDDAPLTDSGAARAFALGANEGAVCTADIDCGSGYCVDGVCCESSCGGGVADCEACSRALHGMTDGRCLPAIPGTVCRVSGGRCDVAETCTGVGTACPVHTVHDESEICRPSTHPVCDPEERCDGAALECPTDRWATVESACGTVPSGACDLPDHCEGAGPRCVEAYVEAGTACNAEPVRGSCDTADVCTGDRPDCPPTFLSGVECRASSGGCDPPEICLGTAAGCPPDQVSPTGTVCRAPSDITCDPVESCDGVSAACPANTNTCPDFDAGPDPGGDAGGPPPATGCACRASRSGGSLAAGLAAALALALKSTRRRRR